MGGKMVFKALKILIPEKKEKNISFFLSKILKAMQLA
jgi:hypothetical protein